MREIINKYYDEFKGLPNGKPIVRNNIQEDAFTLVVLDILYSKIFNFDITVQNLNKIKNLIVAPPDGGIDIFIEHEDGDEYFYDIIQVKYSDLGEQDIKQCFALMERTIQDYLKDPKRVALNLREVISNTNFDKTYKDKCNYYVIHKGDLNYAKALKKNERIVTCSELDIIKKSLEQVAVPEEIIRADSFNNYILYELDQNERERAFLCNLNGYDLARLNNKYASTEVGKNILFGQNLREALETKSKTFEAMKNTIDNEPEKFWYYNNGITIIAEEFDANKNIENESSVDFIKINNFSIINGAQTTSSLGLYLKEANIDKDDKKVENLKKVYVLTRILEITKPQLRDNISIYNNMQNPITSRDMVSNREEQRRLYDWLGTGEKPNIYVEIRRGSKIPAGLRLRKHQATTNEELAQLAFASFLTAPFMAKDKKKNLFNNDYSQDEYVVNEDYHKIFNYSNNVGECGILFRKTKDEIDEVLFIKCLYKESKKYLKSVYKERIGKIENMLSSAGEQTKEGLSNQLKIYYSQIEINNICMFYCIALYYEFKSQFGDKEKNKIFKYDEYYSNSDFKDKLIKEFANVFLSKTIELIKSETETTANVGNWVRTLKSQTSFMKRLRDDLAIKLNYETEFQNFITEFKL